MTTLEPEKERERTGADETGERDPAQRNSGDRWKSAALSVLLALVLLLGGRAAYASWPETDHDTTPKATSAPESPSPTEESGAPPDETTQANDMDTLLQAVKTTRSEVPDTLGDCATVGSDLGPLQQVVQERQEQVDEATNLRADGMADGMADGEELKQALVDMAQSTLDADQQYLNWAQQEQSGGCTAAGAGDAIGAANQQAADAKRRFVSLWNPVAEESGLSTYTWKDF